MLRLMQKSILATISRTAMKTCFGTTSASCLTDKIIAAEYFHLQWVLMERTFACHPQKNGTEVCVYALYISMAACTCRIAEGQGCSLGEHHRSEGTQKKRQESHHKQKSSIWSIRFKAVTSSGVDMMRNVLYRAPSTWYISQHQHSTEQKDLHSKSAKN